jgi:hypothetical protein
MENLNSVLKKIEKLLALAESSNPNEAELASKKAQKLMIKYNVDLSNLGVKEEYEQASKNLNRKLTQEDKLIVLILKDYFHVAVVHAKKPSKGKQELLFGGTPTNLAIAEYMYHFFKRVFNDCWVKYRTSMKGTGVKPKKNPYMYGLYISICKKLDETVKECKEEGLIIVPDQGLTTIFNPKGKVKMDSRVNKDTLQGIEDGAKVVISKGVTFESENNGLLLGNAKK